MTDQQFIIAYLATITLIALLIALTAILYSDVFAEASKPLRVHVEAEQIARQASEKKDI